MPYSRGDYIPPRDIVRNRRELAAALATIGTYMREQRNKDTIENLLAAEISELDSLVNN